MPTVTMCRLTRINLKVLYLWVVLSQHNGSIPCHFLWLVVTLVVTRLIYNVVYQFLHLGHILKSSLNDYAYILSRTGHFIGQINNLLCSFQQLDSLDRTKTNFKSFCGNVYGCQL